MWTCTANLRTEELTYHRPSLAGKESSCIVGDPNLIPGSGRFPGERIGYPVQYSWASLVTPTCNAEKPGFNPWVGKVPWRRAWQPPPVFLPGEYPWTEDPGGLLYMELQRVGHDWETKHSRDHSWLYFPWQNTEVLYGEKSEVAQSCPTLCDPMDCSLPGSSIHGIFQARILQWVAISFSRRSSQPRNWTQVFCIAGRSDQRSPRILDWIAYPFSRESSWHSVGLPHCRQMLYHLSQDGGIIQLSNSYVLIFTKTCDLKIM